MSERQSNAALEAAGVGVWEWDLLSDKIVYCARAKALVGLAPDVEPTLESLHLATHPDDRARYRDELKRLLEASDGERIRFEWRVIWPDGSAHWLLAQGRAEFGQAESGRADPGQAEPRLAETPQTEGGPRPIRYAGSLQNIDEFKIGELTLRENEARLRVALAAGKMGVWEYDIAREEIKASPELNAVLGFPPDDRLTIEDLRAGFPPGERERVLEAGAEALRNGRRFFEIEYRYRGPDEKMRWLTLRAEFMLDAAGEAERMIGVLMDVTSRQAADETNAYLAAVVSSSADAIITFDRAADILSWNEAAERIFGYSKEEAIGRPFTIISPTEGDFLQPDTIEKVWAGELVQFEGERRRKDGRLFHAALTAAPVRAPNGRIVSVVTTVRDGTSRKNNERRQALLVRELHHRVRNTLATVQAVAGASARYADSLEEFRETFAQRISSLAQAHALLTDDNWQSVDLRELMLLELKPYAEFDQISLEGPRTILNAQSAIPISMAMHELTTNAAKHGALSKQDGRVSVEWSVDGAGEARELSLSWRESGGPPVEPPRRRGFGSLLLNTVLKMQLNAQVESIYGADGFEFRLRAALQEPSR